VLSATVNPFAVQEMAASILALTSLSFVLILPLLSLQFVKIVKRIEQSNAEQLKNMRRVDCFIFFMTFCLRQSDPLKNQFSSV